MTSAPAYVSLHDARKLTARPIMVRFDLIEEKKGYMAANSSWVKRLEHITCQVPLPAQLGLDNYTMAQPFDDDLVR